MQAVILAAGLNTRFLDHFDEQFIKQSLQVAEVPIMIRSMHALQNIDCSEIVIVVGENRGRIEKLIKDHYTGNLKITFIDNLKPERGNGYSLGLTQIVVLDRFYLLMSDHLYDQAFINQVKAANPEITPTLFVDYKIDKVFDIDDATKVNQHDGRIRDIGKTLTNYNCIDTGFFILNEGFFKTFNELEAVQEEISISGIITEYSKANPFYVTDIGEARWQDVDDVPMYEHAKKLFGEK